MIGRSNANFKVSPRLSDSEANKEEKPGKEAVLYEREDKADEWPDELLLRKPHWSYWSTLRITAWALRFAHNCLTKTETEEAGRFIVH